MAILDMPNYIWITLLIMVVLTLFCTLVLNKTLNRFVMNLY